METAIAQHLFTNRDYLTVESKLPTTMKITFGNLKIGGVRKLLKLDQK